MPLSSSKYILCLSISKIWQLFPQNVSHTVEKMFFDEKDFPTNVPLGKFRNIIEFLMNQRMSARLVIKGRIVPN